MSERWIGVHKLTEEIGELLQVLGKLGAFPDGEHPDGRGDLLPRLEDELGDVSAALDYFIVENRALSVPKILSRTLKKTQLFKEWGLAGWQSPPSESSDSGSES